MRYLTTLFLVFVLSGCGVWHYIATDTTGRNPSGAYTAETSAYGLTVVEERTTQHSCIKRLLYFDARGGLHSRPHVEEAHAEDRDCDMRIDNVRLTRASDQRAWTRNRGSIMHDFEEAYYKAVTQ